MRNFVSSRLAFALTNQPESTPQKFMASSYSYFTALKIVTFGNEDKFGD